MEEMKRAGKTNREIGEAFGLEKEQVQDYFKRSRIEQRLRGYRRSGKDDTAKTNQELRTEPMPAQALLSSRRKAECL